MHLFTAWPKTGKENLRDSAPVCILKTLIHQLNIVLWYTFDDIFHISQRCSTSHSHWVKTLKKAYVAVLKTSAENQSKLSTTLTKIKQINIKSASCWRMSGLRARQALTLVCSHWKWVYRATTLNSDVFEGVQAAFHSPNWKNVSSKRRGTDVHTASQRHGSRLMFSSDARFLSVP